MEINKPGNMAALSLAAIAAFFSGEEKLIKRGENAYKSNRMDAFDYDGTYGVINASVKASMKNKTYKIKVSYVPSVYHKFKIHVLWYAYLALLIGY